MRTSSKKLSGSRTNPPRGGFFFAWILGAECSVGEIRSTKHQVLSATVIHYGHPTENLVLRASYDRLNTTNIRLSVGRYCDPVTSIRFVRRHGCYEPCCSYSARFFIALASVAARRSASAFRIFLTPFTLIRRLPGRSYGGNSINSIKSRYVAAVRKYSHWKSSALSGGNWVRSSFIRLLYTCFTFGVLSAEDSVLGQSAKWRKIYEEELRAWL